MQENKYYTPDIEEMKFLKQLTMLSEKSILKYFENRPESMHKNEIINQILKENEPRRVKVLCS